MERVLRSLERDAEPDSLRDAAGEEDVEDEGDSRVEGTGERVMAEDRDKESVTPLLLDTEADTLDEGEGRLDRDAGREGNAEAE